MMLEEINTLVKRLVNVSRLMTWLARGDVAFDEERNYFVHILSHNIFLFSCCTEHCLIFSYFI